MRLVHEGKKKRNAVGSLVRREPLGVAEQGAKLEANLELSFARRDMISVSLSPPHSFR